MLHFALLIADIVYARLCRTNILIERMHMKIAVVGLGYVGLPLAVEIANAGLKVVGVDVIESKVQQINRGISYIQDVPTPLLARHVNSGMHRAVPDFKVLRESGVVASRREGNVLINSVRFDDLEARFPGVIGAIIAAAN